MSTELPGYVSCTEAALRLGVCDSLVRRYVREERLPSITVGARIKLIPIKALEKFATIERKPGPKPSAS